MNSCMSCGRRSCGDGIYKIWLHSPSSSLTKSWKFSIPPLFEILVLWSAICMSDPTSMSADLSCHTVRKSKALVEKSTKGETRGRFNCSPWWHFQFWVRLLPHISFNCWNMCFVESALFVSGASCTWIAEFLSSAFCGPHSARDLTLCLE